MNEFRLDSPGGLHHDESPLWTALDSLNEAFCTVDACWRFTFVNKETARLFRSDTLTGRILWEAFPDSIGTAFERELRRAIAENVTASFEQYFPPDEKWYYVKAYPSAEGLAVSFRDVTETHRMAAALSASEERFRILAGATNDAIWDWDLATNVVWRSEGFANLFGHNSAFPGTIMAWANCIHKDDRARVMKSMHKAIEGGVNVWRAEYRFERSDGAYTDVVDRGQVIRNKERVPVRMIGGMTDVTRQKHAERQIREQAALLDYAQDAIMVRDLDDNICYWNKSAERLYGLTALEVNGVSVVDRIYQDPVEFRAAKVVVLRDGEWMGELRQLTSAGEKIIVETRWTLVRNDAGEAFSILAINTDITKRKLLEQQFLRAQRMELIGTLAGGLAHDLNNVLTPILLSVDLLRGTGAGDDQEATLSVIESSARRGADMVDQVLSFARGTGETREDVRIEPLMHDLIRMARDTFPKNVQIDTHIDSDLWMVRADPTQLHQVMLNLCVNARDAMPEGGTITISARNCVLDDDFAAANIEAHPGPHVLIDVDDTGRGIDPEIVDRIFDPFFTTKEVGKGTGLGLSTSLAIVRRHQGILQVEPIASGGTRFRVCFPAQPGLAKPVPIQDKSVRNGGNGELILVVDDEPSLRQVNKRVLESNGYRVIVAANGAEAVSIYKAEGSAIDLVITDMLMPVMGGPATIRALLGLNPGLRYIYSSGFAEKEDGTGFLGDGDKNFLAKPYTARALLQIVRTALERPTT